MSSGKSYKKVEKEFEYDEFGDPIEDLKMPDILTIISLILIVIGVSWVVVCMGLYFITKLFNIGYNLIIASLIWLVLGLIWVFLKK